MADKHTISDLYQMQSLPLSIKIRMTERRIRDWVEEYGVDGVYVSFSGGKDSTVLLDIARRLYPNIKAVFIDTGLEYPEIRKYVQKFENVDWLKPKLTFRQVIEKYGYPFISKEVSECVYGARKFLRGGGVQPILPQIARNRRVPEREHTGSSTTNCADKASMLRPTPGGQTTSIENLGDWESIPVRVKILFGAMTKGNIPSGERSRFSCERYKFFLDADFEISSECCKVMKKAPAHSYAKRTGRKPMTAQMASESRLRTQQWLKNGCNGFDMKTPISNPMSFWTEQDVLLYITLYLKPPYEKAWNDVQYAHGSKRKKARKFLKKWDYIKCGIASVYGDVVTDFAKMGQIEGQISMADTGIFDLERPALKTTGCERTGCMFCGYGCHLEKSPGRFERMKLTHPKQYEYIMKSWETGGLGFKEIIDWINEHGNLNIRY